MSARIFGTSKGRRFPTFAVGLNGVGGYRLQVSPGKKLIELFKGDNLMTSIPYEWPSGTWTHLRLEIKKADNEGWNVLGKVWIAGEAEPAKPILSAKEKEEPVAGRSSIWGSPFAGTPIRYDDLTVTHISGKP